MLANLPPLDELDDKVKESFPFKIVRKGFIKQIHELERFPGFVREYLISQYCDENGLIDQSALEQIINDTKKFSPEKCDKENYKFMITELGNIDFIDHFQAFVDLRSGKYFTHVHAVDEKATINRDLLRPGKAQELLKGGMWGKASFQYLKKGDGAILNMSGFDPYQSPGAILKGYIESRDKFSTEQWTDLLIRTIGINPERLTTDQKLLYIARLIPLVEPQTNSLELGPPGTGKSYIYENLSEYARMLVGAEITPSKLIYNQNTRQNGLIFHKDVICFDEVNKGHRSFVEIIPKLQQVMASSRVERGDLDAMTDISLVFQGNISFTKIKGIMQPARDEFLKEELPNTMYDCAFLDRIHLFIHGWTLPVYDADMDNNNFGLISDYIGQIFHKLRREECSDLFQNRVKFARIEEDGRMRPISARDSIALKHILNGYLKLIYPNKKISDDEFVALLNHTVKLRQNVINQMIRIDPNQKRTIGFEFRLKDNQPEQLNVESPSSEDSIRNTESESQGFSIELPPELLDSTKEVVNEKIQEDLKDKNIVWQNTYHLPDFEITPKNELCCTIPYWLMKYCIHLSQIVSQQDILIVTPNNPEVRSIILEKGIPIRSVLPIDAIIVYDKEENAYGELQLKLKTLRERLNDFYLLLLQHNETFQAIFKIPDNNQVTAYDKQLRLLTDSLPIGISNENINHALLELDHILLMVQQSAGYTPDLLHRTIQAGISDSTLELQKLDGYIKYWHTEGTLFKDKLYALKREIFKQIPNEDIIEKPKGIFNGKLFPVISIDVNNIITSYKNRTGFRDHIPLVKLKNEYFSEGPYMALFFASKHFSHLKKNFPESNYIKWYIEMFDKSKDGQIIDADVDTLLTCNTTQFLNDYKNQISDLILASGDKDLHVIVETAKKLNIPVTVVATYGENMSKELKQLADDYQFIFTK